MTVILFEGQGIPYNKNKYAVIAGCCFFQPLTSRSRSNCSKIPIVFDLPTPTGTRPEVTEAQLNKPLSMQHWPRIASAFLHYMRTKPQWAGNKGSLQA